VVTEPTTPTLTVRALTADDLTDILELDSTAFGQDVPDDFLHEMMVPELELDRFVGARDPDAGNRLVASACILSKQLTFPGGSVHPVAGVSWVAVRPGWRRRGLLRDMMTAQLHDLHVDCSTDGHDFCDVGEGPVGRDVVLQFSFSLLAHLISQSSWVPGCFRGGLRNVVGR